MISAAEQNKMNFAINWVRKLANGINTLDGSLLPDNDIVNNVHISRCLFYVAELLEGVGKKKTSSSKHYDLEFNLSPEDVSKISITDKIAISVFVKEINKVIPDNMKPLSYSAVTKWLERIGYLEEVINSQGNRSRIPTELGRSIGITTEERSGTRGDYTLVVYDANAQMFILENLFKE